MTDTPKPEEREPKGVPVKEPILMNWLIIIATVSVLGFGSYALMGS